MRKVALSISLISLLSVSLYANTNDFFQDSSIGLDVGTTGVGATFVKKIKQYDKWGIRVGYHKYSKNFTDDVDNVHYDMDLNLEDVQLMADFHPWCNSFKITFGALYNGTDANGKITPKAGGTYKLNGNNYNSNQIGYINTKVEFKNDFAPYIGIGWDTSFYKPKNSWGFTFNLGIAYYGNSKVTYNAYIKDPSVANNIYNDLEKERIKLEDDINDYKYIPYVSVGFNYKF